MLQQQCKAVMTNAGLVKRICPPRALFDDVHQKYSGKPISACITPSTSYNLLRHSCCLVLVLEYYTGYHATHTFSVHLACLYPLWSISPSTKALQAAEFSNLPPTTLLARTKCSSKSPIQASAALMYTINPLTWSLAMKV